MAAARTHDGVAARVGHQATPLVRPGHHVPGGRTQRSDAGVEVVDLDAQHGPAGDGLLGGVGEPDGDRAVGDGGVPVAVAEAGRQAERGVEGELGVQRRRRGR